MRIKKTIGTIILTVPFILTSCDVESNIPTQAQQECDHEWIDLGLSD